MATLPDINTSDVSYIAYWNAIDSGGASEVNPEDVVSAGNVVSYTVYDNGVEGVYDIGPRNATFRVKSDGWFVVYIDGSHQYARNTGSYPNGRWDILFGYFDVSPSSITLNEDNLTRAISSLQSNLSNSGDVAYSDSNVLLYDYQNTNGTTLTHLNINQHSYDGGSESGNFLYTDGVSLETADLVALSESGRNCTFEGVVMAGGDGAKWGSADLISDGLIPDPNTEYQASIASVDNDVSSVSLLIKWY